MVTDVSLATATVAIIIGKESIEISSLYFHWTKQSLDAKPKMVVIIFEITTDNVYRIPSVATEAITYW